MMMMTITIVLNLDSAISFSSIVLHNDYSPKATRILLLIKYNVNLESKETSI